MSRRLWSSPSLVVACLASTGLALGGVVGCGDGSDTAGGGPAGDRAFSLRFEARVGDSPLDCGTRHPELGVGGAEAGLRDLRLYVHDVRLVDAAGAEVPLALDQDGAFQVDDVALLDFEDGSGRCTSGDPGSHVAITGTAPAGAYRGVRFRIGVPFELNHIDITGAPPPLDRTPLFWGWGDGRIFVSASTSTTRDDGTDRAYTVQLASSGCVGDPRIGETVSCERPNRGEVELGAFDPDDDVVVADLGVLFAGIDLLEAPSCHADSDDPSCGRVFAGLGVDASTGAPSPATQSFFRVGGP